jgi:hypothetical protein
MRRYILTHLIPLSKHAINPAYMQQSQSLWANTDRLCDIKSCINVTGRYVSSKYLPQDIPSRFASEQFPMVVLHFDTSISEPSQDMFDVMLSPCVA